MAKSPSKAAAERMRVRGYCHALVCALALVFGAGPTAAQTARDRLEIEVARTDRVLAEAQTVVTASENDRAQNLLALATRVVERVKRKQRREDRDHYDVRGGAQRIFSRPRSN